MKKASLLASAALASIALTSAPAFAQGPFADVPADHWAYAAVDKLQRAGIVIGYPDQTYGGKRAMTRYEFAVAIARLLEKLDGMGKVIDTSQFALKSDLNNFVTRPELEKYALKSDLAGFARQSDVDTLKGLVKEFQTELTTLGVDVDSIKKRLDALDGRVKAIEEELKRVKITGTYSTYVRGNHTTGKDIDTGEGTFRLNAARDANGFFLGENASGNGNVLGDTRVFHDLDVTITGRVTDTVTGQAILNFGNYLPFLGSVGSFTGVRSGAGVSQAQDQTVFKLALEGPVRVPVLGKVGISAGRIPFQLTPYTFKQIDVDAYFNNAKTDLGDIPVDGVKANLNLGPVVVTGFAAKTDPIKFLSNVSNALGNTSNGGYGFFAGAGRVAYGGTPSDGVNPANSGFQPGARPFGNSVSPGVNGAMAVEQFGGARVTLPVRGFTIGGTYMVLAGQSSVAPTEIFPVDSPAAAAANRQSFNRVFVYGGDVTTNILGFNVEGSYTQTNTGGETFDPLTNSIDTETEDKTEDDNFAYDVAASREFGSLFIKGGYRFVGAFFGAPGAWARVGSFQNPVDIKGPYGTVGLKLGKNLSIMADGQFYEGTGDRADEGGLTGDDKINNYRGTLNWKWSSMSSIMLGAELTEYRSQNFFNGNKPRELFYNVGYGYNFSPNAGFKLGYQFIDYDDKETGFDPTVARGGVATAQFSVKF